MPTVAVINYEIPDELHRKAKAEAALRGVTLKDFILDAMRAELDRGGVKRGRR